MFVLSCRTIKGVLLGSLTRFVFISSLIQDIMCLFILDYMSVLFELEAAGCVGLDIMTLPSRVMTRVECASRGCNKGLSDSNCKALRSSSGKTDSCCV